MLLINLIHTFQKTKNEIFKSTLEVLVIKGMMSPHTPVNAYFAVFIEGTLGQFFFNKLRSEKVASILLAFCAGIYSAFQRIVVLTILFGLTLWESLDSFTLYTLKTVFNIRHASFSLSQLLIAVYVLIHLLGALYFGIAAHRLKEWIQIQAQNFPKEHFNFHESNKPPVKRKKFFNLRLSGKLLLAFILILLLLSYFNPGWKTNAFADVLIMTARAVGLTLIWYLAVSPLSKKWLNKLAQKGKSKYWEDIDDILKIFPKFNGALNYAKKSTNELKGIRRAKEFFKLLFLISLVTEN